MSQVIKISQAVGIISTNMMYYAISKTNKFSFLAKKNLNILEEDALCYGLNHHRLPKKFNSYGTKANLEQLSYSIKKSKNITLNSEIKDEIKFVLSNLATLQSVFVQIQKTTTVILAE